MGFSVFSFITWIEHEQSTQVPACLENISLAVQASFCYHSIKTSCPNPQKNPGAAEAPCWKWVAFLPHGLAAHCYEEKINKSMWILWKQVSIKYFYNPQKFAEQPLGSLLFSYRSFAWLQLGKGLAALLIHRRAALAHRSGWTSSTSLFPFNLQGLVEDPECSKNIYRPQSSACRIYLCSQPDLQQSHCSPPCSASVLCTWDPHWARLCWSWKQGYTCLLLAHFVCFDNVIFVC